MLKLLFAISLSIWFAHPASSEWAPESAAIGARDHPKITQRFGGEVQNPALSAYVRQLGNTLVAGSDRADETWHFTVLDSPEVNAFALPGGYVYVTRGLVALANSEAELAAVLAHEITHVTEAHVEARQAANKDAIIDGALSALVTGLVGGGENRLGNAVRSGVETALGQIGAYSKEQEFAADAGGIELLRRAGYAPVAQADFLASMSAHAALKALLAGREFDANSSAFFAAHPAPAERQMQARALAGDADGDTAQAAFFAAIDGMIFGDSQRGGFVRGQSFVHTELGFFFNAAEGLRIQNTARQINISGPHNSILVMSGGPDQQDLFAALRAWAAQVPRNERRGRGLTDLREFEVNGMPAVSGQLRIRKRARPATLALTVIRFKGGLIRFASTIQRGDEVSGRLHAETINSFNALSEEGAAEYVQTYLTIHQVKPGETVAELAARMAVRAYPEQVFRVLNGLSGQAELMPGDQVKMITY